MAYELSRMCNTVLFTQGLRMYIHICMEHWSQCLPIWWTKGSTQRRYQDLPIWWTKGSTYCFPGQLLLKRCAKKVKLVFVYTLKTWTKGSTPRSLSKSTVCPCRCHNMHQGVHLCVELVKQWRHVQLHPNHGLSLIHIWRCRRAI